MDKIENQPLNTNLLITGGSGFLGWSIVREFLSEDSPVKPVRIRVLDVTDRVTGDFPEVEFIQGDIRDPEKVHEAVRGMDLVIHAAAIVDWGTQSEEVVKAVNLTGTQHILEACRAHGVRGLVFTSTLDVVFTGKPLRNVDESQPYPASFSNMYCESKTLAEQEVLKANGNGLTTCSLRPSDIFGEGDPYHIGSLIDMSKNGFYVRLGNGKSLSQHVYKGNMAWSHVLAAKAILEGNKKIGGQAYFITDPTPHNFFKFFDQVVAGAGYPIRPKNFWIPKPIAYVMGSIAEGAAFLIRPIKHTNPKFSRFAVTYTCTDFTFHSQKAERDFDFQPKYSEAEALQRTIAYYKERKENGED